MPLPTAASGLRFQSPSSYYPYKIKLIKAYFREEEYVLLKQIE
jgi:hypothetical protein